MTGKQRAFIAALVFLALEAALFFLIDRPLSAFLHTVDVEHPGIINFFRAYTDYGKSKWYLCPCGIGIMFCAVLLRMEKTSGRVRGYCRRAGEFMFYLFVCGAVAGLLTDLIKPILGRARPVELARDGLYGFYPFTFDSKWNSMPSGHSTAAFALAFSVTAYFPRLARPVFMLALLLALSRIMVNAHYVSDVLAGGVMAGLTSYWLQLKGRRAMARAEDLLFPILRLPAR